MEKLRVLQVVDNLGTGGAETWLMAVLRLWAQRELGQMDFLVTGGAPARFDDEARSLGARLHYAKFGRKSAFSFAGRLREVLREGRYHAMHDHQDYASGWHYLMGSGHLPPVRITHVHNPSYQILNNVGVTPSRRMAMRIGKWLVARYATRIAGTSAAVLTEYGFDAPAFRHVESGALHCGVDTRRFIADTESARQRIRASQEWPADSKVVLFAGRIDESPEIGHLRNHKNSAFAVSVVLECARRDSRVRMLMAGAKTTAIPALEERIRVAGMAGRIAFLGVREDLEALMVGADALLFPSRGEGLGMVAVEAQAAGLPVLASTAVPAECVVVSELVRFVDLESGVDAWATELLALLGDPPRAPDASSSVARSAFAIENSMQALIAAYSKAARA